MKINKKAFSTIEIFLIFVIILITLGIGWIFYTNIQNSNSLNRAEKDANTKTYKNDKYKVSFSYPSAWNISEKVDIDNRTFIDVSVYDNSNRQKAQFSLFYFPPTGFTGSNLCCFDVVDLAESNIKAQFRDRVYYNYRIAEINKNWRYTKYENYIGKYLAEADLNTYYWRLGSTKFDQYYPTSFTSNVEVEVKDTEKTYKSKAKIEFINKDIEIFNTKDEAETYMQTEDYKEIKKMMLSLKLY